ncbi:efflux RND transporter periplasmic adaptor subunit, partial [Verrucomicrobiota bacterium]
ILGVEKNALIVPTSSVQLGKDGYYLFAVLKDDTVDLRQVTVGERTDDDYMVIEKGVKAGEKVVTVGQMGLAPGAKVREVSPEKTGDDKNSASHGDNKEF